MTLLTLLSLFWSYGLEGVIPQEVELDRMTVAQAWGNNGRLVWSTFTISCPTDTHGDVTVIGAGWDAVERAAYVPKDFLLDKGDEVTVVGVMRVKNYPPAWVNGQFVPAWTEIWIEGVVVPEVAVW
jgi:hypothetical protein